MVEIVELAFDRCRFRRQRVDRADGIVCCAASELAPPLVGRLRDLALARLRALRLALAR